MENRLQQFLTSRDINEAYEIGRVLGKGAYSVVKAARAKKTNEEVKGVVRCPQVASRLPPSADGPPPASLNFLPWNFDTEIL